MDGLLGAAVAAGWLAAWVGVGLASANPWAHSAASTLLPAAARPVIVLTIDFAGVLPSTSTPGTASTAPAPLTMIAAFRPKSVTSRLRRLGWANLRLGRHLARQDVEP